MQELSDGSRDSNYLDMKPPNSVGYSRVGFNPNIHGAGRSSSSASRSHYLPMGSTQGTPSPMVDVLSSSESDFKVRWKM